MDLNQVEEFILPQAIVTVLNENLLVENGCYMKLYIADWFAKLNHKMGGDLEKIKIIGKYFIEVFKACGISKENVEFIWASDLMFKDPNYWERFWILQQKQHDIWNNFCI